MRERQSIASSEWRVYLARARFLRSRRGATARSLGYHLLMKRLFVSYSHKDERWLSRLLVHLRPVERTGRIDLWADTRIRPGEQWSTAIESALANAELGVLLVSAGRFSCLRVHHLERTSAFASRCPVARMQGFVPHSGSVPILANTGSSAISGAQLPGAPLNEDEEG